MSVLDADAGIRWPCGLRFAILALVALLLGGDDPQAGPTPKVRAALDRISADSLRGHLSFLASDLLEGRDTPSKGQEIAAEYIAAQFRRAGLEPIGDDGYFQMARWTVAEPVAAGFALTLRAGDRVVRPEPSRVSVAAIGPLDIAATPLVKVDVRKADAPDGGDAGRDEVEGKAAVIEFLEEPRAWSRAFARVSAMKPALILAINRGGDSGTGLGQRRLIDPEEKDAPRPPSPRPLRAFISDPEGIALLDGLPDNPIDATLELHLAAPAERPVALRNVVGLLRGSDAELKETCVLVSAHYDGLGVSLPFDGDRIYNGANDDASGTASVVEVASALAVLPDRPRRSILFAAFFGEEKGLLGSRYYGRHPLVPPEKTVAQVNLEHLGRTDDTEGPRVAAVSVTGIDYSDVGAILRRAGELTGIRVEKHPRNSDAFFGASDNRPLADLGIPAHTVCTSYFFPDYHRPGDHWEKIDYDNMARVDRMVALALWMLADDPQSPTWDESNPKAARYAKARKERDGAKPAPMP